MPNDLSDFFNKTLLTSAIGQSEWKDVIRLSKNKEKMFVC